MLLKEKYNTSCYSWIKSWNCCSYDSKFA